MLSDLAAALTARAPTPHSRWLAEPDEPALQALLRARYGETYAYREFYEPGGLARLWRAGSLLSLGEYDDHGQLVAHTGILVHAGRDHAESGLSLIHPHRRSAMTRDEHAAMWDHVLTVLAEHVGFLHQHTSTLHPRAQRYAQLFMRAAPIGLVVDYTTGERLIGIESSEAPMQALAMTTRLRPGRGAARHLPEGRWFAWLQGLFAGLGEPDACVPVAPAEPASGLVFGTCDFNGGLRIARRVVVGVGGEGVAAAVDPSGEPARVDLVHLPVADPGVVAGGAALLHQAGYVPVGVRPGVVDAIVWQRLPDRAAAVTSVARAVLAGETLKGLVRGWSERCGRTS